jgi:hypothetical protein
MGRNPNSGRPSLAPSYVRAEEARLIRRLASLETHRCALDLAIEPFGGAALDREKWRRAFYSEDPSDVVARNGLTGCYSAFLNGYVELIKSAAHLAGLTPHKRDHARNAIECMRGDGGVTKKQAEHLHSLFAFEGRVEHASPDITADEVREAVELLRGDAVALIEGAVAWLERCGIAVMPPAEDTRA